MIDAVSRAVFETKAGYSRSDPIPVAQLDQQHGQLVTGRRLVCRVSNASMAHNGTQATWSSRRSNQDDCDGIDRFGS